MPPSRWVGGSFEEIRRFGLTPKVALVSHSSFGTSDAPEAVKMRTALEMIRKRLPGLEVEGQLVKGDDASGISLGQFVELDERHGS